MDVIIQIIKEGFLSMIPATPGDWLPLIISVFSTVCIVSTSYLRNVKVILVLLATANLAMAISYLMQGSYNGAISCGIGAVASIISGIYDIKERDIPLFISVLYGVAFTVANLIAWDKWSTTGLVVIASVMFAISTVQKTGMMYRVWTMGNIFLWITYDVITLSGASLVSHMTTFTFMTSGMIIDIIRARKAKRKQITTL